MHTKGRHLLPTSLQYAAVFTTFTTHSHEFIEILHYFTVVKCISGFVEWIKHHPSSQPVELKRKGTKIPSRLIGGPIVGWSAQPAVRKTASILRSISATAEASHFIKCDSFVLN